MITASSCYLFYVTVCCMKTFLHFTLYQIFGLVVKPNCSRLVSSPNGFISEFNMWGQRCWHRNNTAPLRQRRIERCATQLPFRAHHTIRARHAALRNSGGQPRQRQHARTQRQRQLQWNMQSWKLRPAAATPVMTPPAFMPAHGNAACSHPRAQDRARTGAASTRQVARE